MTFEQRLDYLRDWWSRHGSTMFTDADDWINSMTNVELVSALDWADDYPDQHRVGTSPPNR